MNRKFQVGDRVRRISAVHHAGTGEYGDVECRQGSVGVIGGCYDHRDYDYDFEGNVYDVEWDHEDSSAINEDDLDFELLPVTPEEEAKALESILRSLQ